VEFPATAFARAMGYRSLAYLISHECPGVARTVDDANATTSAAGPYFLSSEGAVEGLGQCDEGFSEEAVGLTGIGLQAPLKPPGAVASGISTATTVSVVEVGGATLISALQTPFLPTFAGPPTNQEFTISACPTDEAFMLTRRGFATA
jgi:hypothetical protein